MGDSGDYRRIRVRLCSQNALIVCRLTSLIFARPLSLPLRFTLAASFDALPLAFTCNRHKSLPLCIYARPAGSVSSASHYQLASILCPMHPISVAMSLI